MTVGAARARASASGVRSRAAVVAGPRRTELIAHPARDPAAGEVRVRLEGSGVCASSLPVWEGRPWFAYPLAPGEPGHEGWGHVDAVGAGVDTALLGRRVALLSYRAHAEHDVSPAEAVVPLPEALDGLALPGEPLGCAMNVFERADVRAGDTVAVVGVGFLGMLLVQLCAAAGARVLALGRRAWALELARSSGARESVDARDPDAAAARVADLTDGHGCARVIEAAGVQESLTLAGRLAGVRARLVIAGFHQDGPRVVDMQAWNWNGLDVVNAHERDAHRYRDGMRAAVDAVVDGRLRLGDVITHRLPLDRTAEAYELLRSRPDGFLKAVVTT